MHNEPLKLYPMRLKSEPARYLMDAVPDGPYSIPRNDPNAPHMADVIRKALDYSTSVMAVTSPEEPKRLLSVKLALPDEQLKEPRCPDSPDFTPEFWLRQEPYERATTDDVRWVAKSAGCRTYRITFFKSAAVYYLHETNPQLEKILKVARESIDQDRQVRFRVYTGLVTFIHDMELVKDR